MATIRKRQFKEAYLYEVQIRRKGVPQLTISFSSLEQAKQWVQDNEFEYIKADKPIRVQIEQTRLTRNRGREECRTNSE